MSKLFFKGQRVWGLFRGDEGTN